MQLNITFRGMDSTESLKAHVKERVEHLEKYLDRAVESHAVLSLERYLHHADINIHAGPYLLRGRAKTEDMYKSIDEAVDRIERQLKRYKARLRTSKYRAREEAPVTARHDVIEVTAPAEHEEHSEAEQWMQGPTVIRSEEFTVRTLRVNEAVMQMDLQGEDFLVFINAETNVANVVYRRKDGHFGLIEAPTPGTQPAPAKGPTKSVN